MKRMNRYAVDDEADWIDRQVREFGFEDPTDPWMNRIREIESPSGLGSIGPYEILQEVARGGQGIVYKARLRTTGEVFALKRLIGGSYSGAESRARLDRELEAAAALNSPNVVRVLGIDVVDGQPLLAMEWVEGQSITHWATAKSESERLELFATVCDAVHHAHQRGVLHRDLKPSNILVDEKDCPRLLDFGVATFLSAPTEERLTLTGHFAGTPDYAAPERLVIGGVADVRSDVFSLGVVLCEVLTGALPGRPGDEAVLGKLPSDVSSIIRKATDPQPQRRYQSAQALSDDLRRRLTGEPLEARPPGFPTLVRQFVRNHSVAAAVAVTVVLLVTGWGIVAGWLAIRLAERTAAAESAQRTTERVNSFLMDVLVAPRPSRGGAGTTVLSLLETTAKRADRDLNESPDVRAAVHACLGRTYETMYKNEQAATSLRTAVDLYRAEGLAGREKLLQTLIDYAGALVELDDPSAIAVKSEVVDVAASLYGPADGRVASARASLAHAMWRCNGQLDDALRITRESIQRLEKTWSPNDPLLAAHRSIFADLLCVRGSHNEAQREYETALHTLRAYADKESDFSQVLASCLQGYASALLSLGEAPSAKGILLEVRPLQIRLYGDRLDAIWHWQFARTDAALGRPADAVDHAHAALAGAWKLPKPKESPTSVNWGDFFSHAPLAESDADCYAKRVGDALRRKCGSGQEVKASMKWLSGLLADAGYPRHGAAVAGQADSDRY